MLLLPPAVVHFITTFTVFFIAVTFVTHVVVLIPYHLRSSDLLFIACAFIFIPPPPYPWFVLVTFFFTTRFLRSLVRCVCGSVYLVYTVSSSFIVVVRSPASAFAVVTTARPYRSAVPLLRFIDSPVYLRLPPPPV